MSDAIQAMNDALAALEAERMQHIGEASLHLAAVAEIDQAVASMSDRLRDIGISAAPKIDGRTREAKFAPGPSAPDSAWCPPPTATLISEAAE